MNSSTVSEALQEDIVFAKAREFLRELFALYYYQPCLWNGNHTKHKDEFERKLALMKLTKVFKEIFPDITPDMVQINLAHYEKCLWRPGYYREPNPNIWYHDDLHFLTSVRVYLDKQKMKNLPMPEKSSLPAVKNTDGNDKFAILVEDLRSLSTEQYNYVENIISNLIKLAKEKPMPEKSSLPAIKSTDVKDKFEILVEGLWSRSTEEYNCVENIIINLIQLAEKKDSV